MSTEDIINTIASRITNTFNSGGFIGFAKKLNINYNESSEILIVKFLTDSLHSILWFDLSKLNQIRLMIRDRVSFLSNRYYIDEFTVSNNHIITTLQGIFFTNYWEEI